MGAVAEKWDSEELASSSVASPVDGAADCVLVGVQCEDRPAVSGAERSWNVLAEHLVAYPSRSAQLWVDRSLDRAQPLSSTSAYANAWLEGELSRLRERREQLSASFDALEAPIELSRPRQGFQQRPASGSRDGGWHRRPRQEIQLHGSPGRRSDPVEAASQVALRAASYETRGLRRFLPGAATLAVLAGLWCGIAALSAADHEAPVHVLAGSVLVGNHVDYVARPGDTLWSIASQVEPQADPRPLVDALEAQLHGQELQPGDILRLPK
jgi:hypothetical protein